MTTALSLPTAPLSTSSTNSARDTETKSGDNSAERKQLELSQTSIQRHVESHLAVTTQYSSPPNYQYRPLDGQLYVVSGDVAFDTSSEPNDPKATLEKAQLISMASMAPTEPLLQDRNASQQAMVMATQAKGEINTVSAEPLGRHIDVLV